MDSLSRFYTKEYVSKILVQNLNIHTPNSVIDLGIGEASLSKAAWNRWGDANYFGTEVDKEKKKFLKENSPFLKVFGCNTLKTHTSDYLKNIVGEVDLAICNPPYLQLDEKGIYESLFKSIDCLELSLLRVLSSEVVFFAHAIKLLKEDGTLGIILSDSLISGKDYKAFRKCILDKFCLEQVIQLPNKTFTRTEAKTHILILNKKLAKGRRVKIRSANEEGILTEPLYFNSKELIDRMDYDFLSAIQEPCPEDIVLSDLNPDIKRGKYGKKDLIQIGQDYFHSTTYKLVDSQFSSLDNESGSHQTGYATEGDILLCRVGSRVVGKVAWLKKGSIRISDCILRISVEKKYQKIVYEALKSVKGQAWISAYSHGVCSKVLSKSDLLNFPIFNSANRP